MPDRREYYSRWYAEHGGALNARRRKRYREDPEYKARQVRSLRRGVPSIERKERSHRPPMELAVGDRVYVLWSAGVLAKRIGRSMRTVDLWQSGGLLPETPFRSGGVRYYTDAMIHAVASSLERAGGRMRTEDALWYYRVLSQWLQGDLGDFVVGGGAGLRECKGVHVDGGLVAYTLAGAAQKLGRQVQTLVNWLRYQVIPRTPIRYGEEQVLTPGMVRALQDAIDSRGGAVRWDDRTLRQELRDVWRSEVMAYRRRMKGEQK